MDERHRRVIGERYGKDGVGLIHDKRRSIVGKRERQGLVRESLVLDDDPGARLRFDDNDRAIRSGAGGKGELLGRR